MGLDILNELWLSRHPKDALFLSIIDGYTLKESEKYPNRIFYMKGERMLINYDKKTKDAWINYSLIWSVFESKFSLNYEEIIELMIAMLETHLNLKRITPYTICRDTTVMLETHLNLKGITPSVDYGFGNISQFEWNKTCIF